MKTSLDCLPCFVRQTLDAARLVSSDTVFHEHIMREMFGWIRALSFNDPPPLLASPIHRRLRELTGIADIYAAVKKRSTETALRLFPEIEALLHQVQDPIDTAVRLAIAGNVIDFGVGSTITDAEIRSALFHALEAPLHGSAKELVRAADEARSILYLADNAGEIVFDKLLISQLDHKKITVALRGAPILNDATMADARAIGLDSLVHLIDNGSDIPGTVLEECSEEFRACFRASDLIIAKGQGNFETLNETQGAVFFLFRVKCPVVADHTGVPIGTNLAVRGRAW